jgi:hypothetical protein
VTVLESLRRTAIVAPDHPGGVTVYDEASESQDIRILAELAQIVSQDLQCPALAVLNHDDSILALALYENGELTTDYETGHTRDLSVATLCRAWRRRSAAFSLWVLLHAPRPIFEVTRHSLLARLLGLPPWSVGTGYNYLQQGEFPPGLSPANVRDIGKRG